MTSAVSVKPPTDSRYADGCAWIEGAVEVRNRRIDRVGRDADYVPRHHGLGPGQ
jgi:hypothetical protein